MSAIHESSLGTTREDLVTLLWERQLKHVRTVLIEDLVEEGGPGVEIINDDLYKSMGAVAPGDKQKARGRSGMSIGAEVVGRFEQELTPEATAALEALKADHEKEDAIKAFLKALSGMLTTTSDPKELAGIVRLFGDIAAMLLRAGSLRLGLKVLLILEKVEQTNTDEGVAEAIDAAFDAAANPKLIKKSLELLTEDESLRAYALRYLMLVAHAAAETVIDGLHLLPRETLPNIQMILLKAAKSDPAVLRTGLTSKYDQTVHAVMAVVLKVGGADAIQLLSPLLKHPAPRVRAASLAGISKLRPPKLQAYVETGIRDDVSEVRLVAMRASLRLGAEPARVLLMSIVVDGASHLPKLKQVTLFKTLARVADTRVVSGLARILEPSHDSGFTQMMLRASSRGLKRIGVDVDLERDAQFEDYKANVIRCLKLIDLPAAKAVLEKYG